jgi:hypothetical protein
VSVDVIATEQAHQCDIDVSFKSEAKTSQQVYKAAPTVKLYLTQMIAMQKLKDVQIASNVICQKLTGAKYTGSEQEWQGFIDSAIKGLLSNKYEDVEITFVGEQDKVYQGTLINKEYNFTATKDTNKQKIYNLALLDKKENAVYSFSVSGNVKKIEAIKQEFKRLVASFKPSS